MVVGRGWLVVWYWVPSIIGRLMRGEVVETERGGDSEGVSLYDTHNNVSE